MSCELRAANLIRPVYIQKNMARQLYREDQQGVLVLSPRTVTYVFAAPDFNRSADSIGKFVAVEFSRTLDGVT